MAAGIGEASAILAVAQLGISLSNSLISYIGEVQDAPFRIQRISNEVATTSERLRDIGHLVATNQERNIFSEEGISSAIRCSDECRKIIEDVKSVLRKGGWQQKPTAFDKEEIDTSLFSTLRWPFLKRSLEVPRAELQRIKIDLSLLFSSAMALGASTSHEKVKFSQDIPGLQKSRDWAARMADQARNRAKDRSADFTSRGKVHEAYWMDDEPELLEGFVAYQERRIREEEDKKAQERALLLQAEQEAKRKQEEEARRKIEQRAIDNYKKEQDELQTRATESKETFRAELLRLGLPLDQIALIIDNPNLDFGGNGPNANVPTVQPKGTTSGSTTTHVDAGSTEFTNEETAPSRANGRSRRRLTWRSLRKTNGHESPEPSLDFVLSDGSSATNDSIMIETWLLDVFSNWKVEIMPSAEWVEKKFRKHRKREDVWHCFAGLKPLWRDAILQFLTNRNQGNAVGWSLYLIELPHQNSRMGRRGFRSRNYDDQLVRVVLFKRKDSFDASNDEQLGTKYTNDGPLQDAPSTSRPINSYFNQGLTNAQVHPPEHPSGGLPRPKVSFAQEVDEKTDNKNTVGAMDEPLRFNTEEEVQSAIKRLGEKKKKIGDTDQERVDEINDMIVLLAAQLKLHGTLSPSQLEILQGASPYDQTSATHMKSHANTHLRDPKMNPRTSSPVIRNNVSVGTNLTEEIPILRDHRNRPIGKDGTMSRVTRPEFERYREPRYYSYEEDPYDVYAHGRRPYGYEETPIIFNNESNTQVPGYAWQGYSPFVPGKELVIRSPSRLRAMSFERQRVNNRDREYLPPSDRNEEIIIRRDERKRETENYSPRRDEEFIYYPRERDFRDDGIIIRRDETEKEKEKYSPHDEDIIIRKSEREREREKSLPYREEEIIIREEERERARPRYEREEIIIRERRNSLSSADEVAQNLLIKQKPRGVRRQHYRSPSPGYIRPAARRASTFDDEIWPNVESKALVLRTGGSRPTPGYMQEHILDRSIRIRGEQDVLNSPDYPNIRKRRNPTDSRQSSYSERDRAFLPRRPSVEPGWADHERYAYFNTEEPFNARKRSSHRKPRNRDLERVKNRHQRSRKTVSSSEDDDDLAMPDSIASKQQSKPSDEELITQTLKRFTTFQGDQPPNIHDQSQIDYLRGYNVAQNRDSTSDLDRQRGEVRRLETMSEGPDAIPNGNGPRSPSQAPFYPNTIRFPPPPVPPRSPDSTSGSPRKPRAESRGRGYDTDVPVPAYRPQDYHKFPNSPFSPFPEPEHSNNAEIHTARLSSDEVSPALESSTKSAPIAVANGQVKGTKEARITELSDGSSEDGRGKLVKKDRKATVEDFGPDLEAGEMDAGLELYD